MDHSTAHFNIIAVLKLVKLELRLTKLMYKIKYKYYVH